MSKTYVVTGGAGFIGAHLAQRLVDLGSRVHILDDLSTGFKRNIPDRAVFHKVDVSDARSLARVTPGGKVDCVFHFAGQSSGEVSFADPVRDIEVNYKATYNMFKFGEDAGCKRFFFASSMSVYGDVPETYGAVREDFSCKPVSYYGANKLASERLIRIFSRVSGTKSTIFRLFNVYGPGQNMHNLKQGMVSIYLSYLMNHKPILVKGSLNRFRDFIYIDDVTEACISAVNARKTFGGTFNVGSSQKTTVKVLLDLLLKEYHKENRRQWVIVRGNTAGDVTGLTADISRLKKALGWKPKVRLQDGIGRMKQWLDASVPV